jgi:hypothetical protein
MLADSDTDGIDRPVMTSVPLRRRHRRRPTGLGRQRGNGGRCRAVTRRDREESGAPTARPRLAGAVPQLRSGRRTADGVGAAATVRYLTTVFVQAGLADVVAAERAADVLSGAEQCVLNVVCAGLGRRGRKVDGSGFKECVHGGAGWPAPGDERWQQQCCCYGVPQCPVGPATCCKPLRLRGEPEVSSEGGQAVLAVQVEAAGQAQGVDQHRGGDGRVAAVQQRQSTPTWWPTTACPFTRRASSGSTSAGPGAAARTAVVSPGELHGRRGILRPVALPARGHPAGLRPCRRCQLPVYRLPGGGWR